MYIFSIKAIKGSKILPVDNWFFFYSNWGKDWWRGLDFENDGIDCRCNEDGITQWKMPGLLPLVSLQMKGGEGKRA